MSVMQNYGVLRVVSGNHGNREKVARSRSLKRENSIDEPLVQEQALPTSKTRIKQRRRYFSRWLPEERLVHILSQRETTIGRSLSSDIILLDPTVSRDHARLVLSEDGWSVQNVTENNVVRVNDHIVAGGTCSAIQPQDLLVIGNTTLQLVAPVASSGLFVRMIDGSKECSLEQTVEPYASLQKSVTQELQVRSLRQEAEWGEALPLWMEASATPMGLEKQDEWGGASALGASVTMEFAFGHLGNRGRRIFILVGLLSIVVIAGVLLVFNSLNNLFGLVQGGAYSLILALVVPLLPALGINILVNFIDRYEREPWFLRLAAFLWGAIIAIPPALFIEGFIDRFITHLWGLDSQVILHSVLSGLDAGLTEETVKGLGLLLLFFILRDEFDNITDGIVYGALIGAGFAMVENFFYFLNNQNNMSALIVGRIILGWLSHSTFTICFGVALGYIRHTRVRWQHTVVPLAGYLLAVSLHTVFDFIEIFVRDVVPIYGNSPTATRVAILAVIGNYIPPFIVQIAILYILIKSLMHEASIIREFLSSEVKDGVVTVDEYILLPHSFARTRLERRVLWRYGIRYWLLTRALYQTEIGLAFRKWHVSMGDKPKLGYLQPEVAYRKRIKRIRQEIATLETKRTG